MRGCQIWLPRCRLNEPKSPPNVDATNDYEPTQLMRGCADLSCATAPIYHLLGNVISAVISLVYVYNPLTCSPNMSFLALPVSDDFRSLEKLELRHRKGFEGYH